MEMTRWNGTYLELQADESEANVNKAKLQKRV